MPPKYRHRDNIGSHTFIVLAIVPVLIIIAICLARFTVVTLVMFFVIALIINVDDAGRAGLLRHGEAASPTQPALEE